MNNLEKFEELIKKLQEIHKKDIEEAYNAGFEEARRLFEQN